jgi:hypothetical protein
VGRTDGLEERQLHVVRVDEREDLKQARNC